MKATRATVFKKNSSCQAPASMKKTRLRRSKNARQKSRCSLVPPGPKGRDDEPYRANGASYSLFPPVSIPDPHRSVKQKFPPSFPRKSEPSIPAPRPPQDPRPPDPPRQNYQAIPTLVSRRGRRPRRPAPVLSSPVPHNSPITPRKVSKGRAAALSLVVSWVSGGVFFPFGKRIHPRPSGRPPHGCQPPRTML